MQPHSSGNLVTNDVTNRVHGLSPVCFLVAGVKGTAVVVLTRGRAKGLEVMSSSGFSSGTS